MDSFTGLRGSKSEGPSPSFHALLLGTKRERELSSSPLGGSLLSLSTPRSDRMIDNARSSAWCGPARSCARVHGKNRNRDVRPTATVGNRWLERCQARRSLPTCRLPTTNPWVSSRLLPVCQRGPFSYFDTRRFEKCATDPTLTNKATAPCVLPCRRGLTISVGSRASLTYKRALSPFTSIFTFVQSPGTRST
jgi:hypothetical protein